MSKPTMMEDYTLSMVKRKMDEFDFKSQSLQEDLQEINDLCQELLDRGDGGEVDYVAKSIQKIVSKYET